MKFLEFVRKNGTFCKIYRILDTIDSFRYIFKSTRLTHTFRMDIFYNYIFCTIIYIVRYIFRFVFSVTCRQNSAHSPVAVVLRKVLAT